MLVAISICACGLLWAIPSGTFAHNLALKHFQKYEYGKALELSINFYEAQRASNFPEKYKIKWRQEAAKSDGQDHNVDLTGGWFDAGDFVKFGFPMAWTTTTLLWAAIDHWKGFAKNALGGKFKLMIKTPLDYFLQAHTAPNELYVQVGDGRLDHAYWGRPENMTMDRPSFAINADCPGTDVAAETAAALAAGSIFFEKYEPEYSAELLRHAKELYAFAWADGDVSKRARYHECVTAARTFYSSHSFNDELVWGGAWLHRAAGSETNTEYLDKATDPSILKLNRGPGFSWDSKMSGYELLLYQLTGDEAYKKPLDKYFNHWFPANYDGLDNLGGQKYTPDGLAFRSRWGSLRYAASSAFIVLHAHSLGIMPDQTLKWGLKQINYILGDNKNKRSYVVGFGKNPPQRPHHRSSSCPAEGRCSWLQFGSGNPNPHVLEGALVGGPDEFGNYDDDRTNYIFNEVACDYNAGYTAALTAIEDYRLDLVEAGA